MKIKKKIIIILLILLTLISIQTACADNNITEMENVTSINEDTLNEVEINEKTESNNELDEKLSEEKIDINIEPIKVRTSYQTGNCTFKVTNSKSGDLIKNKTIRFSVQITGMINYQSQQITKTDENGIATFILKNVNNQNPNNHNLNAGIHNLTITGLDDLNGKLITPITVEKGDVIITPVNYQEDKGSSKKFTIKVTSKQTGEGISDARLSLYIPNSKDKYYNIICSQEGIGEIGVSELNIGEYPVTIKTNDTNLNNAESSSVIKIKSPAEIHIESIAYYYNSGETIVLKLTNKTGQAISGVLLNITIDGKTYSVKTGKDGKSTFTTSLNVGSHDIKVSVNSNIYYGTTAKTVNIKKSVAKIKIYNKNSIYYKGKKQLIVKLINTKTNKAIFKSKLNVQYKKNGKLIFNYHGTTNQNGEIRFNIKLKPGQYTVSIKGEDSGNFILKQVKTKLTVKKIPVKLTVKKASKKLKIKVTKGKTKKTLSGVKLKVNVKTAKSTKTYYVKSNSKGIALLKLKSGSNKVTINVNDKSHSAKILKKTIKV